MQIRIFLANLIGALALIVSLQIFAASNPGDEQAAGHFVRIKGEVGIQKNGAYIADVEGKRGRKIVEGAPFYVGETVVTGADARAKLVFVEGGNEVVLGSQTSLVIERASVSSGQTPGTSLRLDKGEVRSHVNMKYSAEGDNVYEVKTPNAVAGVRGTVFLARFSPLTFVTEIATERGKVMVSGFGGIRVPQMVEKGSFTAVLKQQAPAAPRPIESNPALQKAVDSMAGDGEGKVSKNALKGGREPASIGENANHEDEVAATAAGGLSAGSISNVTEASSGDSKDGSDHKDKEPRILGLLKQLKQSSKGTDDQVELEKMVSSTLKSGTLADYDKLQKFLIELRKAQRGSAVVRIPGSTAGN